jgi:hypothetical protein
MDPAEIFVYLIGIYERERCGDFLKNPHVPHPVRAL